MNQNIVVMLRQNDFNIESARQKYKPSSVKILLIAEAPPNDIERFFYYEDVREKDFLFLGVVEVIYPELKKDYILKGRRPESKRFILNKLKSDGIYLIDLSDTPMSFLVPKTLDHFVKPLLEKVKDLVNMKTKIILIKANIYDALYTELKELGHNVINKRIPFPSSGQQENFRKKFSEAINSGEDL